jgi:hypothetical protein
LLLLSDELIGRGVPPRLPKRPGEYDVCAAHVNEV